MNWKRRKNLTERIASLNVRKATLSSCTLDKVPVIDNRKINLTKEELTGIARQLADAGLDYTSMRMKYSEEIKEAIQECMDIVSQEFSKEPSLNAHLIIENFDKVSAALGESLKELDFFYQDTSYTLEGVISDLDDHVEVAFDLEDEPNFDAHIDYTEEAKEKKTEERRTLSQTITEKNDEIVPLQEELQPKLERLEYLNSPEGKAESEPEIKRIEKELQRLKKSLGRASKKQKKSINKKRKELQEDLLDLQQKRKLEVVELLGEVEVAENSIEKLEQDRDTAQAQWQIIFDDALTVGKTKKLWEEWLGGTADILDNISVAVTQAMSATQAAKPKKIDISFLDGALLLFKHGNAVTGNTYNINNVMKFLFVTLTGHGCMSRNEFLSSKMDRAGTLRKMAEAVSDKYDRKYGSAEGITKDLVEFVLQRKPRQFYKFVTKPTTKW